ncbi:MAG: Ribosomal large subunit pseudouridine synthase D [Chlamydiales bacterium]|nr:Ribosomal large subunit pseudouridine synthase D [Chlamydiales bacterium]
MQNDPDPLIVSEQEAGMRLDTFLSQKFPDYSRSYFQSLIIQKLVLVNTLIIKKATKLECGDTVEVEFALTPEIAIEPEDIPLDILYEDAHLLAINKPPGLVVHPAVGHWSGTFVNALLYHCKQRATTQNVRPGIVHRLDKDTSGVLIAAKDEMTQRQLVEAFANQKMHKEYRAICIGNPGNRTIETLIGRHPYKRKEMSVVQEKGKLAKTSVETLAYDEKISYIKLIPSTGRTHQLRVHLKHVGFPILGDPVYGNISLNNKYAIHRQLLHAHLLRFIHPITKEEIELKAPLPQDINKYIQTLTQ